MNLFSTLPVAYIDPATTGQIVAIVTGIVISLGVALGIMRTRIMMFFQKRKIARMEKKIAKETTKQSK